MYIIAIRGENKTYQVAEGGVREAEGEGEGVGEGEGKNFGIKGERTKGEGTGLKRGAGQERAVAEIGATEEIT